MITYRTRWKRYVELWFDEPEPTHRCDVVVRHRALCRGRAGDNEDFYTLQVDLSETPDEIFSHFARNTRAQIRKSGELDDLRFEFIDHPTTDQLREFIDFYDAFARSKGMEPIPVARAEAYRVSGQFSLSRVANAYGALTWHANAAAGGYVSMMYSASHFRSGDDELRKLIGRANRRLHWEELQYFRGQGRRYYDFGGWYAGSTDEQKLSINRFKEEFGGKKVLEFTVTENRSLIAKALAALHAARTVTR